MAVPSYIPLRNHSAYSLLEGAIPLKKLIQQAKAFQLPALGLCDTGNLFGAMEFSLACQEACLQPILGCQIQLHASSPGNSSQRTNLKGYPLPLYVQNAQGYQNLCHLVTCATVAQEQDKLGQVSLVQLVGYTEGLIALTGGHTSLLNQWIANDQLEKARAHLRVLQDLFPGRLYIELNRYGLPEEEKVEPHLIEWAYAENLPLIATNEAFFLDTSEHSAHDALLCVADGTYVNVPDRRFLTPHHHFKSVQDLVHLFEDIPEALQNTVTVAQRCHFLLEKRAPLLPPYPTEEGCSEEEELKRQAHKGLLKRLQSITSKEGEDTHALYKERLDFELNVIISMGFAGYFLIVADFIQWAKSQKIPVGPGRGSGASSCVAWALTITDVDPLRFHLLFERFLNPERVSMPDFDVDFCQDRRDEVIQYVQQKYGKEYVAHIITFGKLQARAVLRDVGRVLQMPYGQVDRICKRIPNHPTHPVTLKEAIAQDAELAEMGQTDPQVGQLLEVGQKLEGLYRHASTHAAGIVIGGRPLVELLPLYQDPRALLPATQFSMKYVELAGLIKFDFLGLKTLTILEETLKLLDAQGVTLDLSTIPLDDKATFELLCRVETVGIFQVESGGMSDVLRKLQPETFEEIIALVALYRPGPMDDIPRYIACRHGHEKVRYAYPCLESILKETFGVMVYQEQVLQIARTLAGYSLGSADILRRAMGKKIKSEMDAQRKIFVDGTLKHHGGAPEIASQLFDQIAKFAGYAFPKAHATPYALITYQTAYLKANFPVAFMAASLTLDAHNIDKIAHFTREVRRMKIPLLPPDVNASQVFFSVEKVEGQSGIRYGLAALKNVGKGAMEEVINVRTTGGPFTSLYDFFERLSSSKILNKRQMESLIQAGAFDSLHPNRRQLIESLEILLKYSDQSSVRESLFSLDETRPPLVPVSDFTPLERLRYEFSSVGIYLSQHPLDIYQESLETMQVISSNQLVSFLRKISDSRPFTMVGVLGSKQEKTSKAGQKYAFLQLSDAYGVYEVTLFSEALLKYRSLLEPGQPFLLTVTGRLIDEEVIRLSVHDIQPLDSVLSSQIQTLDVHLQHHEQLKALASLLSTTPEGSTQIRVFLTLPDPILGESCCALLNLPQKVALSGDLKAALALLKEEVAHEKDHGEKRFIA